MKLPLSAIREDPGVQLRGGLDMDRVEAMTEFVEQGGQLPPVTVVGDDNLLADGHHRLYVAETMGRVDIDANRMPGGSAEAVALAMQLNDIATSKPLTRTQRNEGVKLLLQAGWTKTRIAKVTGVARATIVNIDSALVLREKLPPAVSEEIGDTVAYRIAALPAEQQVEFAEAVVEAGLSEPRVREAANQLRRNGKSPTDAVEAVTPVIRSVPATLPDVAKQVRRRLERFLEEPMTIEGQERNFWQVLEVLAAHTDVIPLEAKGLANLMIDMAARSAHFADVLWPAEAIEA